MHQFKAELIKVPNMDATYVIVPFEVEKIYGKKGQVKVKANIDGELYRGSIARMEKDGLHLLIVTQAIRKKINKSPGDSVNIILQEDTEARMITIPDNLQKLFQKAPKAKIFFEGLSYTNRKEYVNWIESAKKPETKQKRLALTIEKLLAGRKNPSI